MRIQPATAPPVTMRILPFRGRRLSFVGNFVEALLTHSGEALPTGGEVVVADDPSRREAITIAPAGDTTAQPTTRSSTPRFSFAPLAIRRAAVRGTDLAVGKRR